MVIANLIFCLKTLVAKDNPLFHNLINLIRMNFECNNQSGKKKEEKGKRKMKKGKRKMKRKVFSVQSQ
jgi:hypothetical protein